MGYIEDMVKKLSAQEPDIIVNGIKLSVPQAMTVRVAIFGLASEMETEGLGDDEHGAFMTQSYLKNAREVIEIIMQKGKNNDCSTG